MKHLKLIVLFFTLLFSASSSIACDVINGSDIKFIHLSRYKYHVKYILYHQCVCKLGIMPKFTISCGTSNISITPPRTSIRDITPVCSNGQPPCSNSGYGGTRYGIEEHIFEDTIDFEQSPYNQILNNKCCEVMFRVAQPWGLVGTTTATTTYGGEAMLNLCTSGIKGNNTPTLSTIPMSFMCCNQPFTFNNGVFDNIDADSMSFELDEPLSSTFTPVTWNTPLNKDIPLTPFCPPNPGIVNCRALPNAKPPRGFYFDKETGDMVLTPTKCDESGPVAIRVTEYRKDSATKKMVRIGFVRRDIYVTVVTCSDNNPPVIEGNNKWSVCEGNKICFRIKGKDEPYLPKQTVPDTVEMTWNAAIKGATFKILDTAAREKEAEFCWTPNVGDARTTPYSFAVTAKDDACPRPAYSIKGFNIKVNPKARSKRQYDILECGKFRFTSNPADTVNYNKNNYQYKFTIRDSTNSGVPVYYGVKRKDSLFFKRGGKYIIEHEINNPPFNCPTIYSDTVIIPPVLDVELALGKDTFVCAGNNITFEPIIKHGHPNYKYRWESPRGTFNPKDTLSKFTLIKSSATTTVVLGLTDGKKCQENDTIVVHYQKNPIVDIGPDQRICTYQFVILDAQNKDTMRYYWLPNGDSTRTIAAYMPGKYIAKVIDKLGCNTSDTMQLFVNDTVTAIAKPNKEICIYDTLKVKGMRKPHGYPKNVVWKDLGSGATVATDSSWRLKIMTMATRKYEMQLKVTQSNVTCEDVDTLEVVVNALPTFSFNNIPPRCYADGAVNLTQNKVAKAYSGDKKFEETDIRYFQQYKKPSWIVGGPVGVNTYKWDFPSFITNDQLPSAGLRDTICYDYRDYKGCYNKECKPVKLNPNPAVELKEGTFCQRAGAITLDNLVVKPFVKSGGIQSFRCIQVPMGSDVDPQAIISQGAGFPVTTLMDPGLEGENEKTGDYKIEYCYKDAITGCQSCDTTTVTVVRLPEIKFDVLPKLCINFPLVNLDSFASDRNTGKRFRDGIWSTVEYGGSRDMNNPNVKNKIENSTKNNKQFDPSLGAGQYLVKLYDASSGCPVADSMEILVNGLPIVQINVPDTVCSSSPSFELENVLPQGQVGKWSGPGVTGRQFDPSISPQTKQYEGKYQVKFEYTNPITGCTSSDSQTLLIQSQPTITVVSPSPYQQCEGKLFDAEVSKLWANSMKWSSSGDGSFADNSAIKTTYQHGIRDTSISDLNGNVALFATTIKEGVCPTAQGKIDIKIEPYPQFDFLADPKIQCEPAIVNFISVLNKPLASPNVKYYWYFGNGDSLTNTTTFNPQNILYDTAKRTWYDVKVRLENQYGSGVCATTKDSIGYIKVLPQPKADFSSDPGYSTTVAFPKFKFQNLTQIRWNSPGSIDYLWYFGTGDVDDTSTLHHPVYNYPSDTNKYRVHLSSIYSYPNPISPLKQCFDTIGKVREIDPDVTVFVPTAFSPERSGPKANNVFKPIVNGEKTFHIDLFNRWGQLLWTTDDKNASWDGSYMGEDVQQDVYMWVIKVTAYDGKEYTYEGTVSLLR